MIWLWRICFSGLWLWPAWCATVTGAVVLTDSRDPGVRRNKDFKDVVVWLEPANREAPHRIPLRHFKMVQKNKHFNPHVLAIPVGATVDFPNEDPIFHNVFSNYSGQIFDLSLYRPYTSRDVVFTRPGIVRVFCNIHPTMSAVIAVLDTPWFAVSKASGEFAIRDVPPGNYRLHIFHERATDETLQGLVQAVSVESGTPKVLPAIRISETGYIPAPHKNKWDKDYPPVIDDQPAYRPNQ
ncbi:MAG TPA: carboxypeptidase regulatory-like domain-containing protein [Bryobacteraceae bacterium]|nr:carboxypeptidase regulatory-like domain-containing protein [Bryobacteraceae bacterium]